MSDTVTPANSKPPSPRQVLLGLFILFQLAFLFLSNGLGFLKSAPREMPDRPAELINRVAPRFADQTGHGWKWLRQIEGNLDWWVQLTGQDQEWALFAPGVARATGFPCVVLLWDDTPPEVPDVKGARLEFDAGTGYHLELDESVQRMVVLRSENEPDDINAYFRVGKCRLRRCEGQLYQSVLPRPEETPTEAASRVTANVKQMSDDYQELVLAYLQWRVDAWQREHSGEPAPREIILCQRTYRIHGPDEEHGWDGPRLVPLCRWRRTEVVRVLEPFDFTEERFRR